MPSQMFADAQFDELQNSPLGYPPDEMPSSVGNEVGGNPLRTKRCVLVGTLTAAFALIVFLLTGEKALSAGLLGSALLILSLYHTPFALMVLYVLLPLEATMPLSPTFSVSKAMGILVLVSFAFARLGGWKVVFPAPFKAMLALAALAAISIVWALSAAWAAWGLLTLLLQLGLILILVNTIRSQADLRMMMWALVVGGTIASFFLVSGVAAHETGPKGLGRVAFTEEEGASLNSIAANLVICFIAVVYHFLDGRLLRKVLMLSIVPLLLLAILKTQARTALGTAFLAPLVAFVFAATGRKRLTYGMAAIALSCLGYGVVHVALNTNILPVAAQERFRDTQYDLKESGRAEMWNNGIGFFLQRPVQGWGWKNFHVRSGGGKIASAHNNIVSLAAELGVLGLGVCATIYLLLLIGILRVPDVPLRWLGLAFVVATLSLGLTMTTYFQKNFWYALGFAIVVTTMPRSGTLAAGSHQKTWVS